MNIKNDVEVIINNKRYTLCGYESGEYLQKVASYINNKQNEFKSKDSFRKLEPEMKNILLDINIADDYFKAHKQVEELEEELEAKNNEIFKMKHEMIRSQTESEELKSELQCLKADYFETQKKIVKLETELEERRLDYK